MRFLFRGEGGGGEYLGVLRQFARDVGVRWIMWCLGLRALLGGFLLQQAASYSWALKNGAEL